MVDRSGIKKPFYRDVVKGVSNVTLYNFSPGPAMLPSIVMKRAQAEFRDYAGLGASIIEISHRSPAFLNLLDECIARFKELTNLPANYRVIFIPGGARMLFSAVPLNLMGRKPAQRALYSDSGEFAKQAIEEAQRYGEVQVIASSRDDDYRGVPAIASADLDPEASYLHVTSNNTVYGTAYPELPLTGSLPLVVDATSDWLSRPLDFSQTGIVYGGLQKNLGPSGLALVVVRDDLLDSSSPLTPLMLSFRYHVDNNSLGNTINTFAVYMFKLVLDWLAAEGGIPAMAAQNQQKSKLIYDIIDASPFYEGCAHSHSRSHVNVTFRMQDTKLEAKFLKEAEANGLFALQGHRFVGGLRASLYNGMPLAGAQALAEFMKGFAQRHS